MRMLIVNLPLFIAIKLGVWFFDDVIFYFACSLESHHVSFLHK